MINYRLKFFLAFIGFLLFWFTIFYPKMLPYMNETKMNPLLALVLFEGLLYLTILMLIKSLLSSADAKVAYKWSFLAFIGYHIIDAVEPPMILNPSGMVDAMNPTAIISWDYAIGNMMHQATGWSWQSLFYVVNIGVLGLLLFLAVEMIKPGLLKQTTRRILT